MHPIVQSRLNQKRPLSKLFEFVEREKSQTRRYILIVNLLIFFFRTKSEVGEVIEEEPPKISRHYIYTKHFPLFNDDTIGSNDCNQRYVLLFGVGKERDEQRHAIKKMVKGRFPISYEF